MSEPRSLPPRPELHRLRREARQRRQGGEFPSLALAQLAVAREYGFRSWPRLQFHVEAVTLDAATRASALHQAVWRRRSPRTVTALLDAGAPVGAPDEHGLTPLQVAVRWGDEPVAGALRERGADQTAVTAEDLAIGGYLSRRTSQAPPAEALAVLDEMVILAIQGGHREPMIQLLDAGARVDGDPDSEEIPLGQACWRGPVQMARDLIERGAALAFRTGGSAIGAALHGSRHCHDPEGGPSMRTIDEIPKQPHAEIVETLIAVGSPIPDRIGDQGARTTMLIAELGINPPRRTLRLGLPGK